MKTRRGNDLNSRLKRPSFPLKTLSFILALSLSSQSGADTQQCLCLYIVSFSGTRNNCDAVLNWNTASEPPYSQFAIDRSSDSSAFVQIAVVPGISGNPAPHQYSFRDSNPYHTGQHVYYRIRNINGDGTTVDTSQTIAVNMGNCTNTSKPTTYCNNGPTEISGPVDSQICDAPQSQGYKLWGGTPQTTNWHSSNTSVADINSLGILTPKGPGTVTLTAHQPYCNRSFTKTIRICPCNSTAVATNLTGTIGWESPSFYGYTINFTPVPGATSYGMEWLNVKTNSLASTNYVSGPGHFFYYFTPGHTYKYRLKSDIFCSAFSDWSEELEPPPASCSHGPTASTLSQSRGCGSSGNCVYTNFNWPAVNGAKAYRIQYTVYNTLTGATQPEGSTTVAASDAPTVYWSIYYGSLQGTGWVTQYRVAVECGDTPGNYSGWSVRFPLQ